MQIGFKDFFHKSSFEITKNESFAVNLKINCKYVYIYFYNPKQVLTINAMSAKSQDEFYFFVGDEQTVGVKKCSDFVGTWTIYFINAFNAQVKAFLETKHIMAPRQTLTIRSADQDFGKPNAVLARGRKWYAGDLHSHTTLSDGHMPLDEYIHEVQQRGLDFNFITEHNLMHFAVPKSDVAQFQGYELTFLDGHLNLFGARTVFDVRSCIKFLKENFSFGQKIMALIAKERVQKQLFGKLFEEIVRVHKSRGGIASINHPKNKIFGFKYDIDMDLIDCIEIMNSPARKHVDEEIEQNITFYDNWLSKGYKITAVGGSDTHNKPDGFGIQKNHGYNIIGRPTTFCYASELNQTSVLRALKKGNVYFSRYGKEILFRFIGVQEYLPGDLVKADTVKLHVSCIGHKIRIVVDGQKIQESMNEVEYLVNFNESIKFARIEIRDEMNHLIGFINPLFNEKFFNESLKKLPVKK